MSNLLRTLLALSILSIAPVTTACWLPVSTAAPQPATTVGKGHFGATFYSEFPTLDLLASQTEAGNSYALAPTPTMTAQIAYGVHENVDIELAVDGAYYLIIPLPLGGSAGVRYHLVNTPDVNVALAARIGTVGLGVSDTSDTTDAEVGASADYVAGTVSAELVPSPGIRPGVALSLMPAEVHNEFDTGTAENFSALATSLTARVNLVFGPVHIGPFANLVYFRSPSFRGSRGFVTGGMMLSLRPAKNPPAPPAPPPVPAPTPWEPGPWEPAPTSR